MEPAAAANNQLPRTGSPRLARETLVRLDSCREDRADGGIADGFQVGGRPQTPIPVSKQNRNANNPRRPVMKHLVISLLLAACLVTLSTIDAGAIVCARGVHRAGCVAGGGGAVVVRTPV